MHAVRPGRVTEQEFLNLPESTRKVELLDGEVIMAPSPNFWHQEVLIRLVSKLRAWAATQPEPWTIGMAPMDIRFAEGRILQPDAFVIGGKVSLNHAGPLDRVPLLCVEVLSSDRAYDRITKRIVYAQSGVYEYWAVEPAGYVEQWHGPELEQNRQAGERLETPLLPGFVLDVQALFEP